MGRIISKVSTERPTWPVLVLLVAGGCAVAAVNWLTVARNFAAAAVVSSGDVFRAELFWQMWTALALALLIIGLFGILRQRIASLTR